MALSALEIAKCDQIVVAIVRQDIGRDIAEYYGAAVFYNDNLKPEQPNNEIRNALNHLARAFESVDWEEANENIGAAKRHIERAKRDSLKLAIIGLFGQIRSIVRNAEYYYGAIPPALTVRKAELTTRRRDAYALESAGNPNAAATLLGIFVDASKLFEELQAAFPAAAADRKLRILFLKLRRQLVAIVVGFVLGVLASLLAATIWDRTHRLPHATPDAPPGIRANNT